MTEQIVKQAETTIIRLVAEEQRKRGQQGEPDMALVVWEKGPEEKPTVLFHREEVVHRADPNGFRSGDVDLDRAYIFRGLAGTNTLVTTCDFSPLGWTDEGDVLRFLEAVTPPQRTYRAVQPAKGFLRGPTVEHAHVLAGAVTQSDKWELKEDEERAFIKLPDGSAWIPFQTEEEGPKLLSAEILATRAALGPEALKLMLACFNYWVERAPVGAEWYVPVTVSLGDLLRYMGYAHKGRPPEEVKDAGKRLFALSRICTHSKSVRGGGRKKVQEWETFCPLISIESLGYQKSLFGKEGLEVATEVEYHLGKDWHAWLYGSADKRFGLFSSKLLTYSAKNDYLPLMLGWYLSWLFRIRLRKQATPPIHLRTLLEGAYIEWPSNPDNYARFLNRIEAALDRLQADGVIGGWTPQYNKARESVREILERGAVQMDPPPDLLTAYGQASDKLLPPPPFPHP